MSTAVVSTQVWIDSLADAVKELATGMLSLEAGDALGVRNELPPQVWGAMISLVGDEESVEVGVLANPEGCQVLARALLCLEPDDELEDGDVMDSLGEIINILAGGVKSRVSDSVQNLRLGLPVRFQGTLSISENQAVTVADIKVGEVVMQLVVVTDEAS